MCERNLIQKTTADITMYVELQKTEKLEEIDDSPIFENDEYKVFYDDKDGYIRRFPYATAKMDVEKRTVSVEYLKESQWDFYSLGMDKILIFARRLILQDANVHPSGAVVFSQTAENGKKLVLGKKQSEWNVFEENTSQKVNAIVMVEQAETSYIQRLKVGEAFQKIYFQSLINCWDTEFFFKAFDVVVEAAAEIPMYKIGCQTEEELDELVKKVLAEEKQEVL